MRLGVAIQTQQALQVQLAVGRVGDRLLHHRGVDQHLGQVALVNDTLGHPDGVGGGAR